MVIAQQEKTRDQTVTEETSPLISVVIPFHNEEGNVTPLFQKLDQALSKLSEPYEIIATDDGSTDTTLENLKAAREQYPSVRVIVFRKNFGQTAALSAGIDHARGEIIVTMDGDQQNDPEDIPRLVRKMREGYDIVSGWRKSRKEPLLKRRIPSMIANLLISRISSVKLHDYGCTLKAYRTNVIKNINLYGEMHRFVPAIASSMGVRIAEIEVADHPRVSGKSKYGLRRSYKVILDLLTLKFLLTFFHRPMLLFGFMGGIFGLGGIALGAYAVVRKLIGGFSIMDRPLFLIGIPLLVMFGVQLISIGLIAEMTMRTYHESQHKPIYVIREVIE